MENIFNNGIVFGVYLAIIDIISMGIIKNINLGILAENWLGIAVVLYGSQMIIFKEGLKSMSMSVLNLNWNLFSNVVITIIGIYYFNEDISQIEKFGILFALFALFLFSIAQYYK